jgi:hypothetical protein
VGFLSLDFSYICLFSFVSWSKKRITNKMLHPLTRLLKMKTLAIREKRARAAAATMAVRRPNFRARWEFSEGWHHRIDVSPNYSRPRGCLCIFVHSLSLSEQLFCKLLTCAGRASWACAGRDATKDSSW